MNLNFRKTALLAGICSVFSLGYAPQLFAVSSTDTVEAVQQTKKITGVVSDAMGPIIGANVLEKGTTNGVITDIDGNFALNVKPGATIVVSIIRKTKCSPLFKRSDISYKTKRPPKNNFPKYSRGSKKSTGKFCFSQCFFL